MQERLQLLLEYWNCQRDVKDHGEHTSFANCCSGWWNQDEHCMWKSDIRQAGINLKPTYTMCQWLLGRDWHSSFNIKNISLAYKLCFYLFTISINLIWTQLKIFSTFPTSLSTFPKKIRQAWLTGQQWIESVKQRPFLTTLETCRLQYSVTCLPLAALMMGKQ